MLLSTSVQQCISFGATQYFVGNVYRGLMGINGGNCKDIRTQGQIGAVLLYQVI